MKHEPVTNQQSRYRLLLWIALVVFLVGVWAIPIGHDAIWAVWIGRQVLQGATLYRDIIEVNPPLWFWLAVPQSALGLEAAQTVRLFFAASIVLSLLLIPPKYRLLSLIAFAALPLIDFGQREHFTLIATTPYVFLCAQRLKGERPRHAILIGVLAAIGFALKPYFVVVPLALELAVWRLPRIRQETVTVALCAALYAIAVPLFAPAYLTEIIPQVVQYYGYFSGGRSYATFIAAISLAAAGAIFGRRKGPHESRVLALTAIAFLPAVLLQAKGWTYQTIPVRGFLFLAIAVELLRERRSPWADSLLVASAIACCSPFGVYKNGREKEVADHLAGLTPGTTITAITMNPSMVWPMIGQRDVTWVSRQFATWQLDAARRDARYVPAVRSLVSEEIRRRPTIILVDRRPFLNAVVSQVLPSSALKGYRSRKRTASLESYELLGSS